MFPLKDENPTRTKPILTIFLIVVNTAIFIASYFSKSFDGIVYSYGMKPALVLKGKELYTIFTSMFLHGGVPTHLREHAVPLDIWQQHRGRPRQAQIPVILSLELDCRRPCARLLRPKLDGPYYRRVGSDLGRARGLYCVIPSCQSLHLHFPLRHLHDSCDIFPRLLVLAAGAQHNLFVNRRSAFGGRILGAHRWLHSRSGDDLPDEKVERATTRPIKL